MIVEFSANRYRPEGKKFDRVYVTTTERFRGSWLGATHTFRTFGLINENEMAHECNIAPPCGPEDKYWKYEFEIKLVERD